MEITSKPYLSLLEVFTKMNNVAGLGSSGSQRAMDMRMKIQYINEKNQGREPTEDQLEAAMEKVLEWNKEREHLLEGTVPEKSLGR